MSSISRRPPAGGARRLLRHDAVEFVVGDHPLRDGRRESPAADVRRPALRGRRPRPRRRDGDDAANQGGGAGDVSGDAAPAGGARCRFYAITQGAQFVAIEAQPVATTSLALSLTPLLVSAASGRLLGEPPSSNLLVGAVLVPIGATAYLSGGLGATLTGMTAAAVALGANVTASLLGRSVNRARPHLAPRDDECLDDHRRRRPPRRRVRRGRFRRVVAAGHR